MLLSVLLLSLIGTAFASPLSKRGDGHHGPLINCPTCEHHICDLNDLSQCEVCQISVPHKDQPPTNSKCTQAGHCREDNHNYCCDNEACVESYFGQLGGSTIQPVTQAVSFAGCPSCHGGTCDFINRDHCFTCKFDLHDGQLPHVHCLKENEHCHDNHNTLCCNDEPCIAQAFGQYYPSTQSAMNATTVPVTTVAVNKTPAAATSAATTAGITSHSEASTSSNPSPVPSKQTTTVKPITSDSTIATNATETSQQHPTTDSTTATNVTETNQQHPTTDGNNCTDDINNCGIWLSYGVCHALPEQTSMYDLARQCKSTCQLC